MKIVVKILLALLGLIVVLFAGLWIFIKVQFSDDALTAQVNQQLKESLIRQGSVKNVSISLWPPVSLDIEGLTIANRPDSGFTQSKPMLDTKLLSARLDLFDLLQKKLTVEQITADSPYFLLETSEDGKSNLDNLMQPSKPEEKEKKESGGFLDSLSFVFKRISVKNLNYEKLDHRGQSALSASGIDLSLTGKTESGSPLLNLDGDFVVKDLKFSNTFGTLVDRLQITGTQTSVFDTEKGSWKFEKLDGKAGDLPLSVTGYMDSLYTPRRYLNIGITAPESDLKDVLGLLSKSITKDVTSAKTSGKLKFDMKIVGILSDTLIPGFTMNFDLTNGSVQYPKLPRPITGLDLSGTVTEKRLDLKHFRASLGSNKVDGSLIVEDYNRKKINLNLFSQLNLAEVGQYYPLEAGTSVAGTVNSDLHVSAVLADMKSARASGKAEFKNVSARTAKMKTPVTNLNGQLLLNNERVEIKGLSMLLGDSDIQIDGYAEQYLRVVFSDSTSKGKKPFVSGSLRSKNLNIDKLLPEDSTKKVASTAPKKREQLPNVDGQFSVDIASMTVNKITMKDVKGTVKLQIKVLDLSGLGMSVFNGRVGLAGDINLKDINQPIFNLDVDVKEL
ncbi:MAG: AsmA family protein, partial [Chlorobiales bacterium]|nr:AsmA family protein [Chlorobiales bacterium]